MGSRVDFFYWSSKSARVPRVAVLRHLLGQRLLISTTIPECVRPPASSLEVSSFLLSLWPSKTGTGCPRIFDGGQGLMQRLFGRHSADQAPVDLLSAIATRCCTLNNISRIDNVSFCGRSSNLQDQGLAQRASYSTTIRALAGS